MSSERWIQVSHVRHRTDRRVLRASVQLAHYVSSVAPWPWRGEKGDLPANVFATFEGDVRGSAHVERATALGFDVDDPQPSPEAFTDRMRGALSDCGWCVHSTWSASPGAWRFRVFLDVSRSVLPAEHGALWPTLAEHLSDEGVPVDCQCKDPGRIFYVPIMPPSGLYFSHVEPGPSLDVEAWLDVARELGAIDSKVLDAGARRAARHAAQATTAAGRASPLERARAYLAKVPGAISGSGGHAHTFGVAQRLVRGFGLDDAQALALLVEWNATCRPPWSRPELGRKIAQARAHGRLPHGALLEAVRP